MLPAAPYVVVYGNGADDDHNDYDLGSAGAVAAGLSLSIRRPVSGGAVPSPKSAWNFNTALPVRARLF